jgi:xanthine dehydrogenase accessory factor
MANIYLRVEDIQKEKSSAVLATVVRTKGSTPQKPGSSALFNGEGLIAGTVGGGIVEKKITDIASQAIITGKSGIYHFNLDNAITSSNEAICGGEISILVDAAPARSLPVFRQIKQSLENRNEGILLTEIKGSGETDLEISRYWVDRLNKSSLTNLSGKIITDIDEMISGNNSSDFHEVALTATQNEVSRIFIERLSSPEKLVIAGAGHIGRVLSAIGSIAGFDVTVIDDRPEFANPGNIPSASRIIVSDVGEAMKELVKSSDTFVVIVTRGHKNDADALRPCIGTDLAYLGMIGSRKKTDAMRSEFISKGWATPEQWSSIYTPIGLEINSRTVEEIAISIAAQLIMVKNQHRPKRQGCPA